MQWQTSLLFISYLSEVSHIFSPVFQDKVVSVPHEIQEQYYCRRVQYIFEGSLQMHQLQAFSCKPLIPETWRSEYTPAVVLLTVAVNFSFYLVTNSGSWFQRLVTMAVVYYQTGFAWRSGQCSWPLCLGAFIARLLCELHSIFFNALFVSLKQLDPARLVTKNFLTLVQ